MKISIEGSSVLPTLGFDRGHHDSEAHDHHQRPDRRRRHRGAGRPDSSIPTPRRTASSRVGQHSPASATCSRPARVSANKNNLMIFIRPKILRDATRRRSRPTPSTTTCSTSRRSTTRASSTYRFCPAARSRYCRRLRRFRRRAPGLRRARRRRRQGSQGAGSVRRRGCATTASSNTKSGDQPPVAAVAATACGQPARLRVRRRTLTASRPMRRNRPAC